MAIPFIDLSNLKKWFSGSGSGTTGDPYIPAVAIDVSNGAVSVTGSTTIAGTVPAALYGKVSAAGDTPVLTTTAGRLIGTQGIGTALVDSATNTVAVPYDTADTPRQGMAVYLFTFNGATWDRQRTPNKFLDLSAVSIGSIATILTPTSGKKFRFLGGTFSVSAACSVLFEDNASGTTIFRTPKLLADTPYTIGWDQVGNGKLSAAANNVLKATSSAAANITGTIFYTEE